LQESKKNQIPRRKTKKIIKKIAMKIIMIIIMKIKKKQIKIK